jgi:integrase
VVKKRERANGDADIWPRRNKEGKIIGYRGAYWVQTADGRRRRYVSGKNKGETRAALNQARADVNRGLIFNAGSITVGEWLDCWLTDVLEPLVDAGKMAHSTYVRYEGIVNNHLKPALGHRKLKDLTRTEVRRLYTEKGKTLSARSVDYIHVTLQKALTQAVRDDLIPRNVAAGERPRSSRQRSSDEAKALSPTQVRALLEAARGQRNEALYVVAVHTGLRQGELLGLKWADVDLDAGKLSVRRSLKVTEDGLDFGSPKNNASRRSVPLNKTAMTALKAHRARQNEERLQATEWRDEILVFPNRVGGPMAHNNLYYREYKPLLKRAELDGEGFTFHSLRHTFATALFARGQHPKVVQSLLGHSSITQTMDTYSHLMEGMGGDAVGGLDEAFG